MEVHGSGKSQVASLGERCDDQTRKTAKIFHPISESGTALVHIAISGIVIPKIS